jgi:hypothetical protein
MQLIHPQVFLELRSLQFLIQTRIFSIAEPHTQSRLVLFLYQLPIYAISVIGPSSFRYRWIITWLRNTRM